MVNHDLLDAFDDCIERLANSETITDCLVRYPEYASSLRPLLETGLLVREAAITGGVEAEYVKNRMRERVAIAASQRLQPPPSRLTIYRQFRLAVAGIVIFMTAGLAGLFMASEDALPGDNLYFVKRLGEDIWSALPGEQDFARQRIDEVEALLEKGRSADIEFEGEVLSIDDSMWNIAGLPVMIDDSTLISPARIFVGEQVQVTGFTTARRELIATEIRRIGSAQTIQLTPTPEPEPTTQIPATEIVPTQTRPTPSPTLDETNGLFVAPSDCAITPMGVVSLDVRDGGSSDHDIIGQLDVGRYFEVIGFNPANQTWYAVEMLDERTGWISSIDAQLVNSCDNLAILTYPPIIQTPSVPQAATRAIVPPTATRAPFIPPTSVPASNDNDNVNDNNNSNEDRSGSNSGSNSNNSGPGSSNDNDN